MAKSRGTPKRYPSELKERAVKMVLDLRRADPHDHGAITRVAHQLGIGPESLRKWVVQAEVNAGQRGGLSTEEQVELKELRKEVRELRRSNAILRSASAFFAAELDRPSTR
jgi:transposase